MTPAARMQAAIAVLEGVLAGGAAERALTTWARRARYAGSGDRAAVRDHVYDALRRLRSSAWLGGAGDVPPAAMDARAVMAGLVRGTGGDPATLFDGSRHGPAPLGPGAAPDIGAAPDGVRRDVPDWLLAPLDASLGAEAGAVCEALRHRAPVHLRANVARTSRDALIERLAEEGVVARPHPASPTAVEVECAPRGLTAGAAFAAGLFEMQDAGSQALVGRLPLEAGMRVLDLCAGGGGKALAMAAREPGLTILAYDAVPGRLRDLPARARRAGAAIAPTDAPEACAPFDLVVCDVPCSGSGAWRRQPEARWRLTPGRLAALAPVQVGILTRAAALARPGGRVAYMTCSLLDAENGDVVGGAAPGAGLDAEATWRRTPLDGTDGFYLWAGRRR